MLKYLKLTLTSKGNPYHLQIGLHVDLHFPKTLQQLKDTIHRIKLYRFQILPIIRNHNPLIIWNQLLFVVSSEGGILFDIDSIDSNHKKK